MANVEHKGLPVRKHSAALRGVSADAMNGALKIDPQEFKPGQRVYMVVEVEPNGDKYDPMDEGEAWEHVEILKVLRGAFCPGADALKHLDRVTRELEDLRVAETGQERLGLEDGAAAKLVSEHERGLHKRKRKNCVLCNAASDEDIAHADELAARREAHGDGEGDADNPLPPATKPRRSRPRASKKS